jgi:hypothetical protein
MDDEASFLRPDAIIEPLVDGFYAWVHTVAPVQAAMNLAFVQVPLLESYLQSTRVHINATRNPELRGGFFVGIEESRSGEVRDLLASIKRDRADMLEFAAAVAEAEELVWTSATGFDLTPLYPKLPPQLSGQPDLSADRHIDSGARIRYFNHAYSYQLKQVTEFMTWCADHGIKSEHLLGQREWHWYQGEHRTYERGSRRCRRRRRATRIDAGDAPRHAGTPRRSAGKRKIPALPDRRVAAAIHRADHQVFDRPERDAGSR